MKKFTQVTGAALALDIDNLDTDQIMPKQFLRGIDKSGLAEGALYFLRFNPDGSPKAGAVFHKPGFEKAPIIISGPNFGCGSSREHAVWGLQQMGIDVVIAPSFGEIFYSNCFNNGLLAAKVSPQTSRELFEYLSDTEPKTLTICVKDREIRSADGTQRWSFELADRHQTMLLEGLDMLEATMKDIDAIERFKNEHEKAFGWMSGLAGKYAKDL